MNKKGEGLVPDTGRQVSAIILKIKGRIDGRPGPIQVLNPCLLSVRRCKKNPGVRIGPRWVRMTSIVTECNKFEVVIIDDVVNPIGIVRRNLVRYLRATNTLWQPSRSSVGTVVDAEHAAIGGDDNVVRVAEAARVDLYGATGDEPCLIQAFHSTEWCRCSLDRRNVIDEAVRSILLDGK